jgi:hypothetical protein
MRQFRRQAEALMQQNGLHVVNIRNGKHTVYTVEQHGKQAKMIVSLSPRSPERALKNMQYEINRRFANGKA